MTDLKFTSPSGETTLKVEDTGRIGTVAPKTQLHIKMDEPVKYETPMTAIEDIEAQIKVLQSKLEFYKELERTKTPCEEAYKRVYGNYPTTHITDGCWDSPTWMHFVNGYKSAQKDYKVGEYQETAQERGERLHKDVERVVRESVEWCEEHPDTDPLDWLKPQNPEQVADGLKEAFREAVKQGVVSSADKPKKNRDALDDMMDDLVEKWEKDPPKFLKFELGQSLTNLIYDWWEDIFTVQSDMDMETSIDELVERIKQWLPKYQSAAGSQSLGVEDMVEGFNDCLNKIKRKLR
jgi:ribosome-associated translation inhibitor RaiA